MVGSQIWEIYIILKGRGIEGCTLSQRPTAKGRKSSRLSWQTALEFAPKATTFHLGWPGLPGKSRLFDGLAHGSHPSLRALEGVLTHIQTCPPHRSMWTRLDGWWGTVRVCRYILPVGSRLLSATLNAWRESAFYLHEENLIMTDR